MNEVKVTVVDYGRKNLMLRYIDPLTGKAVSKSAKTSNRGVAVKAAGKWEAELNEGRYVAANKLTWAVFRERFEADHGPSLTEKSKLKVDTVLDAVERILSPRQASDLTTERLAYFATRLRTEQVGEGDDKRLARKETTVIGYMRHLRAVLQWGHDTGLLTVLPKLRRLAKAKATSGAKGRAVTLEEFERMLAAVPKVLATKERNRRQPKGKELKTVEAPAAVVEAWRFYLRGLWLSGFRLAESLALSWTDDNAPRIDLTGRRPVVRFPEGSQKSGKAETWPCPPDFAAFLAAVPEAERHGRVFKLVARDGRPFPGEDAVMRLVGLMGEKAGIVVQRSPDGKRVKYASAHDLRRSFCTRWAKLVMPQVLIRLARHNSIATTMKFYVTQSAEDMADAAWKAFEISHPGAGNTSGNTKVKNQYARLESNQQPAD